VVPRAIRPLWMFCSFNFRRWYKWNLF